MDIYTFKDQPTSQRQQTVYLRSWTRNIPSEQLQMQLESRSVSTKYALLPIVDLRQNYQTPVRQTSIYNQNNVFNPGSSAPWAGYSSNIDKESDLRNQVFALQSCSQATYVPSSNSSLYDVKWHNKMDVQQPFPNLFQEQQFQQFNPNMHPNDIGFGLFNNATRQQLKDINN